MTTFSDYGLPSFVMSGLQTLNIQTPTPVQREAIPLAMQGRDLLASAQTGTGKTLAYLIPLVSSLANDPKSTALVLAPTRELAVQVEKAFHQLVGKTANFGTALLIGGESMGKQLFALKKRPRVFIGTPGRIEDHLRQRTVSFQAVSFLVFDETDRMLDMGFKDDLTKILAALPQKRQTLMFSATLPKNVVQISKDYLDNPERISIGSTVKPSQHIREEVVELSHEKKFDHLLSELEKREETVIVFVKSKRFADTLAEKLDAGFHPAKALHGDLRQRQRDFVVRSFHQQKFRILVATDIAARGLDIPHVRHVINYDLPQCPEDYIHRIGRTGRAGVEGFALSMVSPDERVKWRVIHKMMGGEDLTTQDRATAAARVGRKKPFGGGNRFSRQSDDSRTGRSEGRSFARSDRRPSGEGRPYARSDERSDRRSSGEGRPYARSDERSDRRSSGEGRPYARSDERSDRRSSGEGRPYARSDERSDRRPSGEGRPYARSDERSDRRPSGEGRPYARSEGADRRDGSKGKGPAGNLNRSFVRKGKSTEAGGQKPALKRFSSKKAS